MEEFLFLFMVALSGASPIMKVGSNRLSNAIDAEENQFPYMISLQQLSGIQSDTRGHRCGGALISLRHALTAASCTFNVNNHGVISPINPAEYRVFAGSRQLMNDTSSDRHRNVSFISMHPSFEMSRPYVNDIAVITLVFQFPERVVQPIGMWASSLDPISGDQVCTVAGWGGTHAPNSAATMLKYLPKSLFNRDSCATLYRNIFEITIERNMICATSGQSASSGCAGDVGNPLVCYDSSSNTHSIAGILTITMDCRISDLPEVYSRVHTYYQWVQVAMTYTAPDPVPGGASFTKPVLAMLAIFALIQIYL